MSPTPRRAHDCPSCLREARSFEDLFSPPVRQGPARRRRPLALQVDQPAGPAASAPEAGLVLLPSRVIDSWDGRHERPAIADAAAPQVIPAKPVAPPPAPVGPPSAAVAEASSRPARVVEAGTFRISRAELTADVDDIRSGTTGARGEADLVSGFLRHLARAESQAGS